MKSLNCNFDHSSNRLTSISACGIQLSGYLTIISQAVLMFTMPQTRWLIAVYTALVVAANAGSYQNGFNVAYTLLPSKYMAQSMAIKQTITSIVSFISALIGGRILSIIQGNGNMIGDFHICGMIIRKNMF